MGLPVVDRGAMASGRKGLRLPPAQLNRDQAEDPWAARSMARSSNGRSTQGLAEGSTSCFRDEKPPLKWRSVPTLGVIEQRQRTTPPLGAGSSEARC